MLYRQLGALLLLGCCSAAADQQQDLKAQLGKLIFNDTDLSQPAGQSCQSCHQSESAFSSPNEMVSAGANPQLFGHRNVPSISYVRYNPVLHWDLVEKHWVGGFFYDGRATNLQSQVVFPFINPVEMGNESTAQLADKIKTASYAPMLEQLYGKQVWQDEQSIIYAVSEAIVFYEMGPEFSKFNSKYDLYLKGEVKLTALELEGLKVFEDQNKGNCAACHPSQPSENGHPPVFTDFTYDNLGLAKNPKLPFLHMDKKYNPQGKGFIDRGLATNPNIDVVDNQLGKFKVPTLRNVSLTAPYMHNGMFADLRQVIEFYNTRDVDKRWGKPEISANLNSEELGDLKLTEKDINALLAFLDTLNDDYRLTKAERLQAKKGEKSPSF